MKKLRWIAAAGFAAVLFGSEASIRGEVARVLREFDSPRSPGHIFNLGHGISQFTPPDAVQTLVDSVHQMSRISRVKGSEY